MFRFLLAALLAHLYVWPCPAAEVAGFAPKGEWRLAPAGADLTAAPPPAELVEEADLLLQPGPRVGGEGDLLDPLAGRILVGIPPVERKIALPKGAVPQDLRRRPDGAFLLLYTLGKPGAEESYAALLPPGTGPVEVKREESARVAPFACARIVAVTADRAVYLAATGGTLVSQGESERRLLGKGAAVTRRIDPFGAAFDPTLGRLVTLRANGGAVNTIVEYSMDLTPLATRMFLAGETGTVTLEAALPGRLLLLARTDWTDAGPRRAALLLDSLGRVAPLFDLGAHPWLRFAAWDGRFLMLHDFIPAEGVSDGSAGRLLRLGAEHARLAALLAPDSPDPAAAKGRPDPASPPSPPAAPAAKAPWPLPPNAQPLSPVADASGEIYFTDPVGFQVLRYPADGGKPAALKNLADVTPGAPGELFFRSEGRSPGHKIVLEYDADGNYMRILRELESPDPHERHAGLAVAGKDAAGNVHLVYTEGGRFRHELVDYRSGKVLRTRTLEIDPPGGYAADRPWSVTPDGRLRLSLVRDGTPVTLAFD